MSEIWTVGVLLLVVWLLGFVWLVCGELHGEFGGAGTVGVEIMGSDIEHHSVGVI
ncbi:hypothetical protein ACO1KR_13840 [Staphylococcus aureus]